MTIPTEVHLMIPALLPPADAAARGQVLPSTLKALPFLLSRSRQQTALAQSYLRETLSLFELNLGSEVPAGALAALGLEQTGEYPWWILANPVLLQAQHSSLQLLGNASLQLRSVEASQLVETLQPLFDAQQMRLFAPQPLEWLVNMNTEPQLFTTSLIEAIGKDIADLLPQGTEQALWQRLSNDMQMVLHTAKVNVDRANQGKDRVNGVWLWGAGALPKPAPTIFDGVWAINSAIKGACILTHTKHHNLPTNIFSCIPHFKAGGKYLIVIDELQHLAAHGLYSKWAEAVDEIEAVWFAPLKIFLKSGEIQNVVLHTGEGRQFQMSKKTMRQWWRRTKTMETFSK